MMVAKNWRSRRGSAMRDKKKDGAAKLERRTRVWSRSDVVHSHDLELEMGEKTEDEEASRDTQDGKGLC